jgi:outer membrane protein assembly factor BamD (BamD/ComL family)
MKLHADALLNLGHYSRIVNILTENKAYDLNDELLFLLGISSTELGNKKIALHAFNEIIDNFPNSEYQNIAKLQVRVLKR